MYLNNYRTSNAEIILEIDPSEAKILRKFKKPKDFVWNPDRRKASYLNNYFHLYLYYTWNDTIYFQVDNTRFEINENIIAIIKPIYYFWNKFILLKDNIIIFECYYRNPQTRFWSLIASHAMMEDSWDWDTPFEDVYNYINTLKNKL